MSNSRSQIIPLQTDGLLSSVAPTDYYSSSSGSPIDRAATGHAALSFFFVLQATALASEWKIYCTYY